MSDIDIKGSAGGAPEEVRAFADRMLKVHDCPGILSKEKSGYHLYIPCPECLETHGRRELDDPKYSINVSMVLGIGDNYRDDTGGSLMPGDMIKREKLENMAEFKSSICMRTRSSREPHRYSVQDLLNMATVTQRFPDIHTTAALSGGVGSAEREEMWMTDPVSGKEAPPPPGEVTPMSELPKAHPAVRYLEDRGYDVDKIQDQFRLSFCHKEFPHGESGIYYRRMPAQWRDTPQHRIVMYSLIDGVPLTWQARIIEKISEDDLQLFRLHPYAGGFYDAGSTDLFGATRDVEKSKLRDEDHPVVVLDEKRGGSWAYLWTLTHVRSNPRADWIPVSPFDETNEQGTFKFKPSKYRTAKYSSRQMMGWDAAVKRAEADDDPMPWVVLCEGPLDAARIGPGGVALIGSSISPENVEKIVTKFYRVFTAFDADKAGREASEKINKQLFASKSPSAVVTTVVPLQIPGGKDVGDLTEEEYNQIFTKAMVVSKRQS